MRKKLDPDFNLDVSQIMVPKCLRKELLRLAYDVLKAAYLGINKTTNRLNRFFWWQSMSEDIDYYCISCNTCQFLAKSPQPKKAPLVNLPIRNTASEYISCDIAEPLPQCQHTGNIFIFSIIDLCTRYPIAIALPRHTAEDIENSLLRIFFVNLEYVGPSSDNGSDLSSHLLQEVMQIFRVKNSFSTIFHPEIQGTLERFHKTMKSMIKALVEIFPNN